jgi:hypothetical protein
VETSLQLCADECYLVAEHLPTMLNHSQSNFPISSTSAESDFFGQDYSEELRLLRNGAENPTEEQAEFLTEHRNLAERAFYSGMNSQDPPLYVHLYIMSFALFF